MGLKNFSKVKVVEEDDMISFDALLCRLLVYVDVILFLLFLIAHEISSDYRLILQDTLVSYLQETHLTGTICSTS